MSPYMNRPAGGAVRSMANVIFTTTTVGRQETNPGEGFLREKLLVVEGQLSKAWQVCHWTFVQKHQFFFFLQKCVKPVKSAVIYNVPSLTVAYQQVDAKSGAN